MKRTRRYGWTVAYDEKRRFHREAVNRIGEDQIIGTTDRFIRSIRTGLLTIEEADTDKVLLPPHTLSVVSGAGAGSGWRGAMR